MTGGSDADGVDFPYDDFPEPGPRRRGSTPTPTPTPSPRANRKDPRRPASDSEWEGALPIGDGPLTRNGSGALKPYQATSEKRPLRYHANAMYEKEERRFDQTALHFSLHGKQMSHADYIAHCEKYDYAWRSIEKGDRILDVGCGTDLALLKAINFQQSKAALILHSVGGCYVGVDMNKLKATGINWGVTIGELDMTSDEGYQAALDGIPGNVEADAEERWDDLRGFTMVVCLEVIEHMDKPDGRKLLTNMKDLVTVGGRIILSTPVYDGKAMARNHIHEYYVEELNDLILEVGGLDVEKRMGTFTAEPALKRWLKQNRPDWYALYMEAREFHSAGYMSGVVAPMVPDIARNNVWLLRRTEDE